LCRPSTVLKSKESEEKIDKRKDAEDKAIFTTTKATHSI